MSTFQERLLEEAFGSPAKIRVLRVLKRPGAGYMSLNQLARTTSLNAMTLARALRSLQDLKLADYIQAGRSKLWRLSGGYAVKLIQPILEAMNELPDFVEQLKKIISQVPLIPEIQRIVLFGSMATGGGNEDSDIDIFIQLKAQSHGEKIDNFLNQMTKKTFDYFGMNPSFFVKNEVEWKKTSKSLKENIQRGIVLYEKKSGA